MSSMGKGFIAAIVVALIGAVVLLARLAWITTEPRTDLRKASVTIGPIAHRPVVKPDSDAALPSVTQEPAAIAPDDLEAKLAELNASAAIVPNELILTFRSAEALAAFRARAGLAGLRVVSADNRLLAARVLYSDPEAMARELREHAGDYENIGLNYVAWVPGLPNTPQTDPSNAGGSEAFGNSGLLAIGATADRSSWGRGVTVAVLDTGVTDHPTLAHLKVTHQDLVKDGQPFDGHGTAMASLIAGNDPENGGVAVATSNLLDIRVADSKGESNTGLLAEAIMKAIDAGARVINISLGTTGDAHVLRKAVEYAVSHGVVIVAAAGNEQQATLAFPAGYNGVISVGAVDATDKQAYFSNSGENLTLAAPGVGIVSAYSDKKMVIGSGTSQATALATGVAATVLGWGYNPQSVAGLLTKSAKATGAPKEQVGAGLLQVPRR